MNKVVFFNPWSAKYGYRIPNSILQVAASIQGKFDFVFVDGNRERDAWGTIEKHLLTGEFKYFGCTVMPGPQLKQAIPFTKKIRQNYPGIKTIWGGYFASNQYKVSIESDFVDYIIDGPADHAFPMLLERLESGGSLFEIPNLIFKDKGEIVKTQKEALLDQDALPRLPYSRLDEFYSLKGYLKKTFLGNKLPPTTLVLDALLLVRFVPWCPFTTPDGRESQHVIFTKI